ncbi:hypothetical protein LEMLEM_LOCUS21647 [Lemmus lemmus]
MWAKLWLQCMGQNSAKQPSADLKTCSSVSKMHAN